MNKEIERQGKNEKERSMLYDKTKEAFIKMWNVRRNKTKTSKVSGENVRKDIKSLLTELWVDIPERDIPSTGQHCMFGREIQEYL